MDVVAVDSADVSARRLYPLEQDYLLVSFNVLS